MVPREGPIRSNTETFHSQKLKDKPEITTGIHYSFIIQVYVDLIRGIS